MAINPIERGLLDLCCCEGILGQAEILMTSGNWKETIGIELSLRTFFFGLELPVGLIINVKPGLINHGLLIGGVLLQ